MSLENELLTEIRDLLQVMAEPALAKRDEKFRSGVRLVAGNSQKKCDAIILMDGSRTQAAIAKEAGMDQGNLSRLVKALAKQELIASDEKYPKLRVKLPLDFFEHTRGTE